MKNYLLLIYCLCSLKVYSQNAQFFIAHQHLIDDQFMVSNKSDSMLQLQTSFFYKIKSSKGFANSRMLTCLQLEKGYMYAFANTPYTTNFKDKDNEKAIRHLKVAQSTGRFSSYTDLILLNICLSKCYRSSGMMDDAQKYADLAIAHSKKKSDLYWYAMACLEKGKLLKDGKKFMEGILHLAQFDAPQNHSIPDYLQLNIDVLLGELWELHGDHSTALSYYIKAYKHAKTTGKIELISKVVYPLGKFYDLYETSYKSVTVFKDFIKLLRLDSTISKTELHRAYLRLGGSYCVSGMLDSAMHYTTISHDYFQSIKLFEPLWHCTSNLGGIYAGYQNYDSALYFFKKTIDVHDAIGYAIEYFVDYHNVAFALINLKHYDEAIYYLKLANEEAYAKTGVPYDIYTNYGCLKHCYEEKGDFKNSLYMLDSVLKYKDSVFSIESAKNIQTLETQYNFDLKEQEKKALESNMAQQETIANQKIKHKELINQTQRKDHRDQIIFGTEVLLFISLFTVLLIVRIISKNRLITIKEVIIEKQKLHEKVLSNKLKALKNELIRESQSERKSSYNSIVPSSFSASTLADKIKNDNNWLDFINDFNKTYNGVLDKLKVKHPQLSNHDIRITAFIKLKLTSKEMAELLVVSNWGITKAKTRLRDRLGLLSAKDIPTFIDDFIDENC